MSLLDTIRSNTELYSESVVYHYEGPDGRYEELTWRQLSGYSDIIAEYLDETLATKKPVIVYGHKDPFMAVCFLACVKSGRAYCPIDLFAPEKRVLSIVEVVRPELILNLTGKPFPVKTENVLDLDWLNRQIKTPSRGTRLEGLAEDEVFYILFTSGSTGTPKGVQITRGCLEHFLAGAVNMGSGINGSRRNIFVNEVPFSFDVSVMGLYVALSTGGTVWEIDKALFGNVRALVGAMARSEATILVATPSFARLCLADEEFSEKSLCHLERILFCGEVLSNRLVQKIRERFPRVEVVNSYGPTETTVAVTDVLITEEIERSYQPLPIGRTRPGVWVTVEDANGKEVQEGEKGEIVIAGATVGLGYFQQKELTEKVFQERGAGEQRYRVYHSGDVGYMKDGYLFYSGRLDTQIKLNGFRIEIEDVENNLMKIKGIEQVAVVPRYKEGQVKSLTGYVVYTGTEEEPSLYIKRKAREYLPEYMIPKKIKVIASMPLTNNGKIDRKLLASF